MKRFVRGAFMLLISATLVGGAWHAGPAAAESGKHYVCTPCGMDCDKTVYDKPGVCPVCGAGLVEQGAAATQAAERKKAALLVFDAVEPIDFTGPFEIFGAAGFDVYTVAATKDPIATVYGMKVVPNYTFADAPKPDVLLVPGGGVAGPRGSAATLAWIRKTAADAQVTLSVCNGAFILASAGLLDGLTATTTAGRIEELGKSYPRTKVVYDQRYVDNGKVITAGGLTSGIDAALHVVSRVRGEGLAQQTALYQEYDWHDRGAFARASLADMLIPNVDLSKIGSWEVARTQGGTDNWEITVRGMSDLSAPEILDRIGRELEAKGRWKSVAQKSSLPSAGSGSTSRWAFRGRAGEPWKGTLTVEPLPGAPLQYSTTLTIAKEHSKAG